MGMWKKGLIDEMRNRVFGWKCKGVITLAKTRATGQ